MHLHTLMTIHQKIKSRKEDLSSGFGGLEVSVLSFGTQVRGFKLGRSLQIFRAKKSSAPLPSVEK